MAREKAARRSCSYERAKTSTVRGDVNIVNEKLRRDYEKATLWAGIAFVIVIGPMLVMHALGVF